MERKSDFSKITSLCPEDSPKEEERKNTSTYRGEGFNRGKLFSPGKISEFTRPYISGDPVRWIDWKGYARTQKINVFQITKPQIVTLLFIGIFGSSYVYFMQVGYNLAPNVGFVNATNAASISLLTLMSSFFFKDELAVKKMIGVFGVTAGLLLLFL